MCSPSSTPQTASVLYWFCSLPSHWVYRPLDMSPICPQNCLHVWESRPHLMHSSLGPSKRHLDWFSIIAQLTAQSPQTLLQKCPYTWGIWTHTNIRFVGCSLVNIPKWHHDRFSHLFLGSQLWHTEWQTDQPCYSVSSNRLPLASVAMQPKIP